MVQLRQEIEKLKKETATQVLIWSNASEACKEKGNMQGSAVARKIADMCDVSLSRLTEILEKYPQPPTLYDYLSHAIWEVSKTTVDHEGSCRRDDIILDLIHEVIKKIENTAQVP